MSALVRGYLRSLATEDSSDDSTDASGEQSRGNTPDPATLRHVEQLYEEARGRASKLAGRPIRNNQELVEVRRQMLKDVASNFRAQGIGISMPGIVNREEMYDRSRARLEAELAAAEERGEELEDELVALRSSIEDKSSSITG